MQKWGHCRSARGSRPAPCEWRRSWSELVHRPARRQAACGARSVPSCLPARSAAPGLSCSGLEWSLVSPASSHGSLVSCVLSRSRRSGRRRTRSEPPEGPADRRARQRRPPATRPEAAGSRAWPAARATRPADAWCGRAGRRRRSAMSDVRPRAARATLHTTHIRHYSRTPRHAALPGALQPPRAAPPQPAAGLLTHALAAPGLRWGLGKCAQWWRCTASALRAVGRAPCGHS